jgi:protein SCO1/2
MSLKNKILVFVFVFLCMAKISYAAEPLPILYQAPSFELTNQNGTNFSSKTLNGKVWIADFKFTSCPHECPLMMSAMKSVQRKLSGTPGVEFVSFTTDPKNDTPKVLKSFMKKFKADEKNWNFLTGNKTEIVRISKEGFKFAADEKNVSHSERFALVDKNGQIRAYYESQSKESLDKLVQDAEKLVKQ